MDRTLPTERSLICGQALGGSVECPIRGILRGFNHGRHLLFWLQPVSPPANPPGWYLADLSEYSVDAEKGEWAGIVRFGGRLYLPEEGEMVRLAVVLVDEQAFRVYKNRGARPFVSPNPPPGLHHAETLATVRR
jgi:hypothetical protein